MADRFIASVVTYDNLTGAPLSLWIIRFGVNLKDNFLFPKQQTFVTSSMYKILGRLSGSLEGEREVLEMKTINQASTIRRFLAVAGLSMVFVTVSLFLLPGCTTAERVGDLTVPLVEQGVTDKQEDTSAQSVQPDDTGSQSSQSEGTGVAAGDTVSPRLNLDPEPDPLADSSQESSLEGYGAKGAFADKDLTINDMLTYAVQDEYLAHGEYLAIVEKFGNQRPYTNIIRSEETHLSLLEEVYRAYDMDFPADNSASHVVIPATLLEAAQTGVQAEIDNIAMYEMFLSYELPANVHDTFTVLMNASESHLKAFQNQVERLS